MRVEQLRLQRVRPRERHPDRIAGEGYGRTTVDHGLLRARGNVAGWYATADAGENTDREALRLVRRRRWSEVRVRIPPTACCSIG